MIIPEAVADDRLIERIRDLESKLEESEYTLGAIRRGEIDALVVKGPTEEHRIFTLQGPDRPYQVLIEQMQEGAITLGEDGTVLYCNRRVADMLGVPQERVTGQKLQSFMAPKDAAEFANLLGEARNAGARGELVLHTARNGDIPVYLSLSLLRDGATTLVCGVLTDLTEQKLHLRELADANANLLSQISERERAEDALRQAQKMEAVGQLTGGLAHDFNNLLTGVTGSLELLKRRMAQGRLDEVDRYIAMAQSSAARAAVLTHRLLAFSRRQTLDPVPTNANRLIAGMDELIRRTVGPSIAFDTVLDPELWPTLCDPHQLENALLNLSINARDAMPNGGKLTVATTNVRLDLSDGSKQGMFPAEYIAVCVTDTGTGMSAEVIAQAFDPFFTTKPIGMGSGLGLSMIYGFALQSGGKAHIDSKIGQGSAVYVYLPRHSVAETVAPGQASMLPSQAAGAGSVLVIDDEPTVRMLVCDMLDELGYVTIQAENGPAGLRVVHSDVRIDLLVTDVGLPGGMNGRQVADAAWQHRPGLKVLFITGYADSAVLGRNPLERGLHIMTKPFAMTDLASKIEDMLGQSAGES